MTAKSPIPLAERKIISQKSYVKRMKELGFKRVLFWLSPKTKKELEKLRALSGKNQRELIAYLIAREYDRRKECQ